ncbi:hypothetical protein NKH76_04025 [Mesorhizobium sp. M0965]
MTANAERRQRAAERILADRIVDHIGADASRQPHDGLSEILTRVDDDMMGTEAFDDARLVVARHRCNDRCAEMACPLHQKLADAAGGRRIGYSAWALRS